MNLLQLFVCRHISRVYLLLQIVFRSLAVASQSRQLPWHFMGVYNPHDSNPELGLPELESLARLIKRWKIKTKLLKVPVLSYSDLRYLFFYSSSIPFLSLLSTSLIHLFSFFFLFLTFWIMKRELRPTPGQAHRQKMGRLKFLNNMNKLNNSEVSRLPRLEPETQEAVNRQHHEREIAHYFSTVNRVIFDPIVEIGANEIGCVPAVEGQSIRDCQKGDEDKRGRLAQSYGNDEDKDAA